MKSAVEQQPEFIQFRILHLFLITFSFAVSFGAYNLEESLGEPLIVCCLGIWSGWGMILMSNVFGTGKQSLKKFLSAVVYSVGMLMVCFFGTVGGCVAGIALVVGLVFLAGV